jgi:hypothetical protein
MPLELNIMWADVSALRGFLEDWYSEAPLESIRQPGLQW